MRILADDGAHGHDDVPVRKWAVNARIRFGLLIAAVAMVAAGCTSSTEGTASFQKPSCSGDHALKAADKSFCFILPPTLHQADDSSATEGILVEIDKNNVINVRLDHLGGDVSALSNKELLDRFSEGLAGGDDGGNDIDTDSGRVFYTAAGRALGYNGTDKTESGTAKIQQNLVFHGSSMMQVICVWTDHEKEIRSACVDVLRSAQITDG